MESSQTAKVLPLIIILIFCASTLASDIYHPVAYWTFDEESGITAYDSIGVSDGTLLNGAARTVGKFGNALLLDGTDDYVEISGINDVAIEFTQNSSFTISLWTNPLDSDHVGWLFSKMRAAHQVYNFGYWLNYGSSSFNSQFNFTAESALEDSTSVITEINLAPVGSWYNVVCVYDNKQMSIYMDGTLRAENTFLYNTGTSFPDKNMAIGARSVNSIIDQYFKGSIDDVRIYNYALSTDEVTQLYLIPEPATICLFGLAGLMLRLRK